MLEFSNGFREKMRALGAEYESVQEAVRSAERYLAQSTSEKAVARWSVAYNDGQRRLEEIVEEKRELRRSVLRPLDDTDLLKRLASAMNSLYEATMGDYSISSINWAADSVKAAEEVLGERGVLSPRDYLVYSTTGRGWILREAVSA